MQALLGVALVAAAAASQPAMAADDGYENVFTSVLTAVGVLSPDAAPEIDYRERAPLVVPPKQSLVKPQSPGATRTAAWPADPDVIRRKKAVDDAKAPAESVFNHTNDHVMSKEEQLKFRAAQAVQQQDDAYGCSINHRSMSHCRYDPDVSKTEDERYRAKNPGRSDELTAGVEPERLYLTQPPKGYLKATKNVAATHEAPQPKRDESSPLSTYIHPEQEKIDPLQ